MQKGEKMSREKIINLKPCPFCGRTPTVEDCGSNQYFIKCKCGIVQDKLYTQRCDAANNWNNRKTVDKDLFDLVREERDMAEGSLDLIFSVYGGNFDDVVKVVRCKDCSHHEDEQPGMVYCPHLVGGWVSNDFFCKDGERRDDGEIH